MVFKLDLGAFEVNVTFFKLFHNSFDLCRLEEQLVSLLRIRSI